MKSLLFAIAIVIGSFLTISINGCASNSKKTETPKAVEEKVAPPVANAPTAKPAVTPKKAGKVVKAESSAASTLTCVHGTDSRIVEVKTSGAGCELVYTKNGEAKTVATAKNGTSYCASISEKLAKNLSAAGFSCK